jgi:hypothetical protein
MVNECKVHKFTNSMWRQILNNNVDSRPIAVATEVLNYDQNMKDGDRQSDKVAMLRPPPHASQ